MEGMIPFGNGKSYEDFKGQIPPGTVPLFDSLRDLCLSLGENIVEDVRMHRVVFCKSISFRWFADIAPSQGGIVIKIQKSRKEPVKTVEVEADQDISELVPVIKEAFEKIR